jgi:hypothetical protein
LYRQIVRVSVRLEREGTEGLWYGNTHFMEHREKGIAMQEEISLWGNNGKSTLLGGNLDG